MKMMLLYILLMVVGGGCIVYGMIKIQWIDGDEWRKRGTKREEVKRREPAQRGNIYSSDGKILATTIPMCDLYLDLYRCEGSPIDDKHYDKYVDTVCLLLSQNVAGKTEADFRKMLDARRMNEKPLNTRRCFRVARKLPYSCWKAICKIPGWGNAVIKEIDGKSVVRPIRAHIYGRMGENVIGMYDAYEQLYTGLEGHYDSLLRGQDGIFKCMRLTRGVWLATEHGGSETDDDKMMESQQLRPKIDGTSIVAAMDTRYQDIADNALRNSMEQYGAESGCAILMEVSTGYVLACSNLRLDTNVHRYEEMMYGNVAVSEHYEPGSTFKTVLMAAMLEDSANGIDTSMRVTTGQKIFPCVNGIIKDSHGSGHASVKEVIVQSSNVGMCELGWRYYRGRHNELSQRVKRIFPYSGLQPDLKCPVGSSWVNNLTPDRDFLNFCYGYSTMVNALQVATFYNALAGNGKMVKPLFCRAIMHNGKEEPIAPVVLNKQMCSQRTCELLKDMLIGVVDHGTGSILRDASYGIAGKTGTSTISYKGNTDRYNASFAGFFPADKPKYSCLVVVRNVAVDGSRAAAPVFRKIADCVVAFDKELGSEALRAQSQQKSTAIPPFRQGNQQQLRAIYNVLGLAYYSKDSTARWVQYRQGYEKYVPVKGIVPNCKGMSIRDVISLLRGMGLKVRFSGAGKVTDQTPDAGTPIQKGGTVMVKLGGMKN